MEELQTTEPIEFLELVEPVEAVDFGDLYLRFKDEDEAFEVLYRPVVQTVATYDDEGTVTYTEEVVEGQFVPRYRNIDTIGIIYKPTGETLLGEDGEYPEMKPLPGWHVNVRLMPDEDGTALEPFSVTPAHPVRVWA
jgi:hypothetical protein